LLKATVFLLSCLLLPACTTEPVRETPQPGPEARAKAYLEEGDYQSAAREFMRLAGTGAAEKALSYRLQAAAAWLEANEPDKAASILEEISISSDNEKLVLQKTLLRARLAFYRGDPERALDFLPKMLPDGTGNTVHADYHDLRARIFESRDKFADAIRERSRLHQYLEPATERSRRNKRRLWKNLQKLDAGELDRLTREDRAGLTGWVELARIYRQFLSRPERVATAVDEWRRLYAGHPAEPAITTQILAISRDLRLRPQSIALLLPFTGPYKRAAEAIRDGFMTARYAAEEYRPSIRVYDSDSLSIVANYRRAMEDGAEFIVGPLEKAAIRNLLKRAAVSVTTLALNRIDGGTTGASATESASLYQFALAPEDEVRQIVHRGMQEEFSRALVITPDNQWGKRLSSTFIREWEKLDGFVLESVGYDPDSRDFITPVKELLNIDSSEQRIRGLRQRIGRNITATKRARKDAEFIYMGAIPVTGKQIVPQFRFFGINDTPIYSTSHIYSGSPDPQLDADMNGVEFTDIPWVLRQKNDYTPEQELIHEKWLSQSSSYSRLYAFGIDAFRIIPYLRQMALIEGYRYNGETGRLSLSDNNIHRRLQWARFVGGRPLPLDTGNRFESARDASHPR